MYIFHLAAEHIFTQSFLRLQLRQVLNQSIIFFLEYQKFCNRCVSNIFIDRYIKHIMLQVYARLLKNDVWLQQTDSQS